MNVKPFVLIKLVLLLSSIDVFTRPMPQPNIDRFDLTGLNRFLYPKNFMVLTNLGLRKSHKLESTQFGPRTLAMRARGTTGQMQWQPPDGAHWVHQAPC